VVNTNLDKYLALKKQIRRVQQQGDEAKGAGDETMKQIKDEFGCTTLKQAKVKRKQLRKCKISSKRKLDIAIEQFEKDWPDETED